MLQDRLKGKTCLVTAAAQGIGRETALRFAHEGAEVLAVDIDGEATEALAMMHAGIRGMRLDVTDAEAVAELGRTVAFDAVFNCVGYVHHGSILDCDEAA